MQEDPEDRVDPMSRIFPRVTKCTFHHYGPSGKQPHSLLVLSSNPFFRNREQEGRPLHPWSQHHQREDLRDPLVLACHPRLSHRHVLDLRGGDRCRARPPQEYGHQEGPGRPHRSGLPSCHQRVHRRLVHDLPCLEEHGFNHVSHIVFRSITYCSLLQVQHLHRGNNREIQDESIG